ncbi:unnamed protein product, partial [Oppiella nova]
MSGRWYEKDNNSTTNEKLNKEINEIKLYLERTRRTDILKCWPKSLIDFTVTHSPLSIHNVFTQIESIKLLEVISSCKVYQNYMLTPDNKSRAQVCNYTSMYAIMDTFYNREIQNLISLSKNLNTFQDLCENDRIALIKYGCTDIICLRSVAYYNQPNEYWTLVMDTNNSFIVKVDILKPKGDLYYGFKNYLNKIYFEWDSDPIILDL